MDKSRAQNLAEAYAKSMAGFETPLVFTTRSGEHGSGEYFDAKWKAEHAIPDITVHDNVVIFPVVEDVPSPVDFPGQLAAGS